MVSLWLLSESTTVSTARLQRPERFAEAEEAPQSVGHRSQLCASGAPSVESEVERRAVEESQSSGSELGGSGCPCHTHSLGWDDPHPELCDSSGLPSLTDLFHLSASPLSKKRPVNNRVPFERYIRAERAMRAVRFGFGSPTGLRLRSAATELGREGQDGGRWGSRGGFSGGASSAFQAPRISCRATFVLVRILDCNPSLLGFGWVWAKDTVV